MAHLRDAILLVASIAFVSGCLSHTRSDDADAGARDASADAFLAPVDGSRADAGPASDAGLPETSCAPADAEGIVCPGAICDGLDSYVWNGERCITIPCGTCVGADCERAAHSMAECTAAHATCEPALCTTTGGEWLFFTEECLHYECGFPQPAPCLIGMPVCNCGAGRSFAPGTGCFDDATCPEVDPIAPDVLCGDTGGTWTPGICCSPRCGVSCGDDCTAPACVCGATQVFDSLRGCVDTAECHVRPDGDACDEARDVRCADGLVCCLRCGGAGCEMEAHCQLPVCDADPLIDECGNDARAP